MGWTGLNTTGFCGSGWGPVASCCERRRISWSAERLSVSEECCIISVSSRRCLVLEPKFVFPRHKGSTDCSCRGKVTVAVRQVSSRPICSFTLEGERSSNWAAWSAFLCPVFKCCVCSRSRALPDKLIVTHLVKKDFLPFVEHEGVLPSSQ